MAVLVLVPMVMGAAIGLLARYLVPGREWTGLFLNPMAAAAASGVVWIIGTLLGAASDNGWMWLGSLVAALVVAIALPKLLLPRRKQADARFLAELQAKRA